MRLTTVPGGTEMMQSEAKRRDVSQSMDRDDFLASLDKLQHYEADEVLPAHEHRFVGLQGRLEELRVHHQHRFEENRRRMVKAQ